MAHLFHSVIEHFPNINKHILSYMQGDHKMMKIICLVSLVYMFAIGSEAWAPRISLPRVRLPSVRLPRIHVPRIRLPRIRWPRVRSPRIRLPISIGCGKEKENTCGGTLVTRIVRVCHNPLCLKIGKRSIDSQVFSERK